MHYVYILQSQKDSSFYIGVSSDLKRRLHEHNTLNSDYSSRKAPFVIKWYCAFDKKDKAYTFEKYLKSSSGYAFWKKRFI
jgi:putative endonuclease